MKMVQLTSNFKGHKLQAAGAGGGTPQKNAQKMRRKKAHFFEKCARMCKICGGESAKITIAQNFTKFTTIGWNDVENQFQRKQKIGWSKKVKNWVNQKKNASKSKKCVG